MKTNDAMSNWKRFQQKMSFETKHHDHDISRFVANTFVDVTNRFPKLNIPSAWEVYLRKLELQIFPLIYLSSEYFQISSSTQIFATCQYQVSFRGRICVKFQSICVLCVYMYMCVCLNKFYLNYWQKGDAWNSKFKFSFGFYLNSIGVCSNELVLSLIKVEIKKCTFWCQLKKPWF